MLDMFRSGGERGAVGKGYDNGGGCGNGTTGVGTWERDVGGCNCPKTGIAGWLEREVVSSVFKGKLAARC